MPGSPAADVGSLHVLLVEDEPAHAELIAIAFQMQGNRHRLTVMENMETARAALASDSFDIVLIDLLLPDGRGTELIPEDAWRADYPVILLTSHGGEQIAVEAMKAGAHDYLVKTGTVFAEMPAIIERVVREWREIRRRREAEKALLHVSRLVTVGELIAGIAHEVNQPLFAMQNLSHACRTVLEQDAPDTEFLKSCLDDISEAAERAGRIVHRLKRFIRNSEPERTESEIVDVVKEAIAFLKFELQRSHVALLVSSDESISPIRIDRLQIQQVLVNLIKNAIEAIELAGTELRRIEISISRQDQDVIISVADSGPGVSVTGQDVFAAFNTTKPEGLGMGLAIRRTIVEAHGGRLTYRPGPANGAVFELRLPVVV
ncbi:response regulator [bacterium]|nr:response regulator [bacterium]